MDGSKKNIIVFSISLIFALGVGFAIGTSLKSKRSISDANNQNSMPEDETLKDKSAEELSTKLSEIMLPEDEFVKLEAAIYQAGVGLLNVSAQNAGVSVTDEAQQELKKSIGEKYSRKYFADLNADSMKELSKDDLLLVIRFYNTEAGRKFLAMSPKIIETTMGKVQTDLSAWMPTAVDGVVAKMKGGKGSENNDSEKKEELPKNTEKPATGEKS